MLDLGKLKIGIEVDSKDAKNQLNEFAGNIDQQSEGLKGKLSSLAGSFKKVLIAGAVAAAAAAGTAIVKISKDALKAYSEFEQLQGGVKKIFGDETAKIVSDNAQKAFRTAGISANQYMEQVTSFSASLIQSLNGDTVSAAKTADMAIQDMADNANTFGTSIDSIQNAYQGFAKQNYTMLDNLKLGYGGTKSEMERLLADAEAFSGVHYDISNLNDVYSAIHVIQEEMNITGTTSKEAMGTIEGSVNAAKAAYQNFLIGLGDENADMDKLVSNLFTSVGAAIKNIAPRLGTIVKSLITTLINTAKNHSKNGLDGIAVTILESIKTWPQKIFSGFASLLNGLADMFEGEGSAKFGKAAGQIVVKIGAAFIKNLPNILRGAIRLAVNAASATFRGLLSIVSTVMNSIKKTVVNIWNAIKRKVAERLNPVVNSGPVQTLVSFVKSAISWWNSLKSALSHPIRAVINTVKTGGAGVPVNGHYIKKRTGLHTVPYDDYKASLHKGEAVLTAAEANIWKKFLESGLKTDEPSPQIIEEKAPVNNYTFGNITVDVSALKDLTTVEDFVDMMIRAKQFA